MRNLGVRLSSTRVLSGMLFGISPSDGATVRAVVILMLLVAALAASIPAIRAARVDPMHVLREEWGEEASVPLEWNAGTSGQAREVQVANFIFSDSAVWLNTF